LLPHILCEKYIKILELGIASPENQHCANCIGTLSFPMGAEGQFNQSINLFTGTTLHTTLLQQDSHATSCQKSLALIELAA